MTAVSMLCCKRLLLAAFGLLFAAAAQAHKASDSYLQFSRAGDSATLLRWDIAMRDLDAVLPLDADGDGALRWGEVRKAFPAIDAYVLPRLQWPVGCTPTAPEHALERRSDGAYVVLRMRANCALTRDFVPGYTLFAAIDPTHRGLATIDLGDGAPQVKLLDPAHSVAIARAGGTLAASPSVLPSFVTSGVEHILGGYDHILFLLTLLLPAVVRRDPNGWRPVRTWREALAPVLGVVTLFTLAHSITLCLAAFDLVSLPSSFIEPAIAVTIAIAALDNLRPVFGRWRYLITFAFGLIHGFGFAGALKEVSLPPAQFAWALLKFNLGIETGQLCLVAFAVPLLFAVRRWRGYPRWVLAGGSSVAILLAAIWFVERVADLSILPSAL